MTAANILWIITGYLAASVVVGLIVGRCIAWGMQ